jgi:DTW domain-containing protein YfiP
MLKDGVFEPRSVCARCRRPSSVCYCAALTSIDTSTRVVILQHPRERDVAIGTARMASLCLPNAELHVGVYWDESRALSRALEDPARPPVLLYPGEGAIDVLETPPAGPVTLVVVDGTWSQAKTVVRESARLRALPRYSFTPPKPSEYRIRREPKAAYVSTIEALVHVLGALEGDPDRFLALLRPFRAMIAAQVDCEQRLHGARLRHARKPPPRRPRVPAPLLERAADLVCIVGEANAWPYHSRERGSVYADELVHWVAHRVATGETFERVIAPGNALAPRTTTHVELSAERLAAGGTVAELCASWRGFVRETDIVCHWGHYAAALFAKTGGYLPEGRVDLRQVARTVARGKVGTLEEFLAWIGAPEVVRVGEGRGGLRLGQLGAIARNFAASAPARAAGPLAVPDLPRISAARAEV